MNLSFRATRPSGDEYAPYYEKYISLVSEGDIVTTLRRQMADTLSLIRGLSDKQAMFAYAPGKWNIKEVVGHVIDGERIFAYRALRIARGDKTPLATFDENAYAQIGGHARRTVADLANEFEHVRISTLDLFGQFDEEAWSRRGTASGYGVSVRAIAWIIAGHEVHHRNIIRERYLR